ncbi:MAG TPA: SDR family NAD(P)-dependent oxidoreductase [Rubricoccaceae bacterium]|nr:SDR family NAD(P)-dependent oxidoreductase [Rubricoccaceae bacterium]
MDLHDKVAVVTGASRGLGRAFAAALLQAGARVFGLARSADDLKAIHQALGERFTPVACDVTKQKRTDAAFARVVEEAGRCDVLINNAGLGRFGDVDALAVDDWHVQVETNLNGLFYCTRAAVPLMKAQHKNEGFGGHIVNVASVAGLVGNAGMGAYNATKFGVRGLSEAWMKELRPHGIKVTCLYPGSVATHFFEVAETTMNPHAMRPEDVAATVLHALQTPNDYLISEIVLRPMTPRA